VLQGQVELWAPQNMLHAQKVVLPLKEKRVTLQVNVNTASLWCNGLKDWHVSC
jgi:hypothetical protein